MPVWSVEGSTFANELEPEPEPGYEMVELRDELVRRSRLARTFGLRKADDVQAIVIGALRRTPGAESPVWRDIVAKQKLRKVVHKHVTRPRQELEREGRLQALHVRLGKEAERLELYNPKVKPQAASAAAFARAVGVDPADEQAVALSVRPVWGRLSALGFSHSKSVLYGGFVWSRGHLESLSDDIGTGQLATHRRRTQQYRTELRRKADAALLAGDRSEAGREVVGLAAWVADPAELSELEAGQRMLLGRGDDWSQVSMGCGVNLCTTLRIYLVISINIQGLAEMTQRPMATRRACPRTRTRRARGEPCTRGVRRRQRWRKDEQSRRSGTTARRGGRTLRRY
jgi:hypothetical protein